MKLTSRQRRGKRMRRTTPPGVPESDFSTIFSRTHLRLLFRPTRNGSALMTNRSDVAVIPLINGIPDLANCKLVDTTLADTEFTGRDIAFDAAGNIHYVSSGQGRYRQLSPGGHTVATTAWNGSSYTFNITTSGSGLGGGDAVPSREPSSW